MIFPFKPIRASQPCEYSCRTKTVAAITNSVRCPRGAMINCSLVEKCHLGMGCKHCVRGPGGAVSVSVVLENGRVGMMESRCPILYGVLVVL